MKLFKLLLFISGFFIIIEPVCAAYSPIGKGIIYYTENYYQNPAIDGGKFNLPVPEPDPRVPYANLDAAYYDLDNGYSVIKGDRYWYRKTPTTPWITNTLQNAYSTSPNWISIGVPTTNIDTAYYDTNRGYTVIKGDRYWYRANSTANWYSNTLQSAYYTSPNAAQAGVPTTGIQAAYYNSSGLYTVIKGNLYWYRSSSTGNWSTGTLESAYQSSPNYTSVSPGIFSVDAAYFNFTDSSYTWIQGDAYWYRTAPTTNWYKSTLYKAYQSVNTLIYGTECSRYADLTDREINYFKDLGLDYVILGFGPASWYNIAPVKPANPRFWNDPNYKFEFLDKWISKLEASGIRVILQLWGTPTWASGKTPPDINGCLNGTYTGYQPYNARPQVLTDYADFVEAVATRYNGLNITNSVDPGRKLKIDVFSLWNEPNLNDFWEGGINNLSDYITLNNLAYDRIKSSQVRPDAAVWGGNVSGGWPGSNDIYFVNLLNTNPIPLKFDVFAIHAYPGDFNSPPRPVNLSTYHPDNLISLMDNLDHRIDYQNKPVAITELGYRSSWENTLFGISGIVIDEFTKARYLEQTLNIINEYNANPLYPNRIISVTNNVFYNPWRWWSTGLVNYYNQTTKTVDFSETLPAYNVFKNYKLTVITPIPTPTNTPVPVPTPTPMGDANGDGYVNFSDMDRWLNGYLNYLTGKSNGDFDGNGKADGKDFIIWMYNFGR